MTFELSILAPLQQTTKEILWVEAKTAAGIIKILKGHEPYITPLEPNSTILFAMSNQQTESMVVAHGLLIVERNKVTILCQ
jgi:F0F1-type ATP synthase epsilon subunit